MEFWPWWLGGLALGGLSAAMWWFDRRPLGVSGNVTRVVGWIEDPRGGTQADRFVEASPEDLRAALLAATMEAAGDTEGLDDRVEAEPPGSGLPGPKVAATNRGAALFLFFVVLGGLLGSLLSGTFGVRTSLGPTFEALASDGPTGLLVLVAGGTMVGFGTRMAGGCTSGHGLSGCSRLQPGSLVATVVFLGVAIAFTLLLEVFA